MKVLAPVDGSGSSLEALAFAADLATRFGGSLDVVHITDYEDDATEEVRARARDVLADRDVDAEPEVITQMELADRGASTKIGRHILELVSKRGYDHVVIGRHGGGHLEKLVLGSASEKVVSESEVPVTVVP